MPLFLRFLLLALFGEVAMVLMPVHMAPGMTAALIVCALGADLALRRIGHLMPFGRGPKAPPQVKLAPMGAGQQARAMPLLRAGASSWERDLPQLCSILINQARNVIADTDGASTAFIRQLTRIKGRMGDLNDRSSDALQWVDRVEYLANKHEAERRELDAAIQEAQDSGLIVTKVMSNAREALGTVRATVQDLKKEVGHIGHVAKAINILAINAEIEAARAGDYGAGFTVIAGEIRKMANETQGLTIRLEPLISSAREVLDQFTPRDAEQDADASGDDIEDRIARQRLVLDDARGKLNALARDFGDMIEKEQETLRRQQQAGSEIQTEILAALATVQFQDVVRQQVEAIIAAVDRLSAIAATERSGMTDALEELMRDMSKRYVMNTQRDAHNQAAGKPAGEAEELATLEFF